MIARLVPLICAGGMVSIASPALAAKNVDPVAAIPAPPAGKGEIVFFRSGTVMGMAVSCAVHENGKKVSSLPPGKYFMLVTEPGKHAYTVGGGLSGDKDALRLEVEPDEIQYATCRVSAGFMSGGPKLQPAKEADFLMHAYKQVTADGAAGADPAKTPK